MNKAAMLKAKAEKYLPENLKKHYDKILAKAEDYALSGKFALQYKVEDNRLNTTDAARIVRALRVDGFTCFIDAEQTLEGFDEHLIVIDWS